MNRIAKTAGIAVLLSIAGAAFAQTTDEARAAAHEQVVQRLHESTFVKPQSEPVAPGDYRAEAHNQALEASYREMIDSVVAYGDGTRSQPIAVNFEDSARAEAARVLTEQDVAKKYALLQTSAQARADLERGTNGTAHVATR